MGAEVTIRRITAAATAGVAALCVAGVTSSHGAAAGACAASAAGPCAAADYDGDRVKDYADNCPLATNPQQRDTDKDTPPPVIDVSPASPIGDQTGPLRLYTDAPVQTGYATPADFPPDVGGDACDADDDGDQIWDRRAPGHKGPDNCRLVPNPDQKDTDKDGIGDVCDPTPNGVAGAIPAVAKVTVTLPKPLRFDQLSTGVFMRIKCTAACQVTGALKLDARSARRARLSKGSLLLGQGAAFLADRGSTWLFVRIPSASVAHLAKSFKRVRPVLTVKAGTKTVTSRRITLRR